MNWRVVVFFAAVIPLSFALALVCAFHSTPTPGRVALGLLPSFSSEGCCDLRPQGFIVLIDTVCWFVLLIGLYAIIRKRKKLLLVVTIPLSAVFALACDGLALQHSVFTPGLGVWGLLHQRGSSDDRIALGLSVLVDTVCWSGVLVAAYKLIGRFRKRGAQPR